MNPGRVFPAGMALVLAGFTASSAAAQVTDTVPPPPDSLRADSLQADTVRLPPPAFVPMIRLDTTDAARGIWRFSRDDILRSTVFNLADLLARVPGLMAWRTSLALRPEVVTAYGGAGGRVEVLRDGYPLDPLEGSVFDLSRISLIEIAQVVVERRPDLLRIHMYTAEPTDARAYSRVEAGVGEPDVQTFRGVFLAPRFLIGPLSLAVERVTTDRGDESADAFIGWARWGVQSENRGVQLELWQNAVARDPGSAWPAEHTRRDIVLRARNRFLPGVVAEVYAGQSSLDVQSLEERTDTLENPVLERSTRQYGVRLLAERGPLWLDGALRYRSEEYLPQIETTVDAGATLLGGRFDVDAGVTRGSWRDIVATTSFRADGVFRPLPGIEAFAGVQRGLRGLTVFPDLRPLPDPGEGEMPPALRPSGTMRSDVSALRVGARVDWRRFRVGGAIVDMSVDSVTAFGLPFDTAFRALPGGDGRAWEAFGRIDVARFWGGDFHLEGSWQSWFGGTGWAYRPSARGTAGAGIQISPLPSGNLEVRGRAWVDHRGETLYPVIDEAGAASFTTLPARSVITADLMIRIIDVVIFARLADWRGENITDIPGRTISGPRLYYGVRWHFWN